MDDRELLASLIASGSREALGGIVERYVGLVYSAALRQVGDRHLAEDVTQGVFIVLAKKAKSLRGNVLLGPWLLKVTRYAALNALKAKNRRKQYEERAAAMRTEVDQMEEVHWDEIREVLDEALVTLSEKDRRAVVLRFFEQRSVDEVANLMGVTPEAAKQRIFRAIEKLRGRLGGKGVVVTAAALAMVIGARAVEAAPVGLATSVTAATGGGLAAGSAGFWIAKGTVKLMAWAKVKTAAIVTAAAILAGGSAVMIKQGMKHGDDAGTLRLPAMPVADVSGVKKSPAAAVEKPAAKNWFEKFDAVYRPAQGEAVKRIEPPFIDERWNWWKSQQPRIPALKPGEKMWEKQFLMEWDGVNYRWKMASVVDGNLAGVMMSILGVKGWEVDGPADLKGLSLPGDWVVVRGAKFEDKLAALEQIARQAGKKVQIKQVGKMMDVFVARGNLD
jgi:RNA polymerase sigma factor (sigma-70 family)